MSNQASECDTLQPYADICRSVSIVLGSVDRMYSLSR